MILRVLIMSVLAAAAAIAAVTDNRLSTTKLKPQSSWYLLVSSWVYVCVAAQGGNTMVAFTGQWLNFQSKL